MPFQNQRENCLLYRAETWKLTKAIIHKLQTFINTYLRRICNIRWPNKITNEELWKRTNETPIDQEVRRRKWKWIGHTLRKPRNTINHQSLTWNPQGKRKRGRPRNTWRRDTLAEMESRGYTWQQLERVAQDRSRWRTVVSGLCTPAVLKA